MDNGIGDYIGWIIVIISFIISGVFGSKNKKEEQERRKKTNSVPKSSKVPYDILEEILGVPKSEEEDNDIYDEEDSELDLNSEFEPLTTVATLAEQKAYTDRANNISMNINNTSKDVPMLDNTVSYDHNFKKINQVKKNNNDKRTFEIDLDGVNDWKKAFVYSEIFNKKY